MLSSCSSIPQHAEDLQSRLELLVRNIVYSRMSSFHGLVVKIYSHETRSASRQFQHMDIKYSTPFSSLKRKLCASYSDGSNKSEYEKNSLTATDDPIVDSKIILRPPKIRPNDLFREWGLLYFET